MSDIHLQSPSWGIDPTTHRFRISAEVHKEKHLLILEKCTRFPLSRITLTECQTFICRDLSVNRNKLLSEIASATLIENT